MGPQYSYTQIESNSQIRLLELHPGSRDDPIRISLMAKSLNELPKYEAISYCWGEKSSTETILCQDIASNGTPPEDKSLVVTTSLFTALRQFRDSNIAVVLWADAICINQDDNHEKKGQIMMMPQIYSRASRVLIWLGAEDDDVQGVDLSLAEASELIPDMGISPTTSAETVQRILSNAKALHDEHKPNVLDYDWTTIFRLLSRPWFYRKWVVQETCLANSAVVICGSIRFPWDVLERLGRDMVQSDVIRLISGNSPVASSKAPAFENPTFVLACQNIHSISMMKVFRSSGTLLDAILSTPNFDCSDLRDHIFALLSLPARGSSVKPDYDNKVESVYINFAITTLVDERNLKLLGLAPGLTRHSIPATHELTLLKLPSWVPNLSGQAVVSNICSYSVLPRVYNSGGTETPPIHVSDDKRTLYCQGLIVDTVQAVGAIHANMEGLTKEQEAGLLPLFSGSETLLSKHRVKRNMLLGGKDFLFPNQPQLTTEQWREFGRVMTCEQVTTIEPMLPETIEAFKDYYKYFIGIIDNQVPVGSVTDPAILKHGLLIETSFISVAQARKLCKTTEGKFAQVPNETQVGDVFVVLLGAEAPFILRPIGKAGTQKYQLIGQAYLDGMMQGDILKNKKFEAQEIAIE